MVHTEEIEGSEWFVSIGGFREISVADVDDLLSSVRGAAKPALFQLFDADRVAGWRHLFYAAVNAVKAFDGGTAVSRLLPGPDLPGLRGNRHLSRDRESWTGCLSEGRRRGGRSLRADLRCPRQGR